MVLTQPISPSLPLLLLIKFPYHYGSYATQYQMESVYITLKFPYHYGSYATNGPS